MKNKNVLESGKFTWIPSVAAIAIGLIFGLIIMLISNPQQALPGFVTILSGGLQYGFSEAGQILYYAAPLLLCGLSVGFAFKTGLFNIGASGQFILGAFGAVYVGVKWTWLPDSIHWLVALLAAMILGGVCALIPGILKAIFNVNEVVSSIMLNYISIYVVNTLVVKTIYDSLKNQSLPADVGAQLPKMGLDKVFNGSSANCGIIIAVIFAVIIYIVMNKTTVGYELKACGFNSDASFYAGISNKRNIILSMVIAGMLAGLGGAILYMSGSGKHLVVQDVIASEGFTGVAIALLGLSNPLGIIAAALFISFITQGGFYLQMYDFPVQLVDIIISSIIYFSAFAVAVQKFAAFIKVRKMKKEESKS